MKLHAAQAGEPVAHAQLRVAVAQDVQQVLQLVHSAYRGEASRAGWTTEADLLAGQRTDAEEIEQLLTASDARLLLGWDGPQLVGSVLLRCEPNAEAVSGPVVNLGMLAVNPLRQGQGWGAWLLCGAERVAREVWGAAWVRLHVLDVRLELLAWYARKGYVTTPKHAPFPYGNPRFGLPQVPDLRFAVLEKALR